MGKYRFEEALEWSLQGKYVEVIKEGTKIRGWVDRIQHGRGDLVLHDCILPNSERKVGSCFVRNPNFAIVIKPVKKIKWKSLSELEPHPMHSGDFTPKDKIIRSCYRNQFAGGFPVVRENGTIINGHKRVEAARVAGLDRHPVEILSVTDGQAKELFETAHRNQTDES